MMKFRIPVFSLLLVLSFSINAQQTTVFTQSIRGTVVDNILQAPIAGATVTLQAQANQYQQMPMGISGFQECRLLLKNYSFHIHHLKKLV